jgi:hypothetical protein
MKKSEFVLRVDEGTLIVGDHEIDLSGLQRAITTLVNLSQEVPGEMLKWDPDTLGEMSIPDMNELKEIRKLMSFIDILQRSGNFQAHAETTQNVES